MHCNYKYAPENRDKLYSLDTCKILRCSNRNIYCLKLMKFFFTVYDEKSNVYFISNGMISFYQKRFVLTSIIISKNGAKYSYKVCFKRYIQQHDFFL